jgi:radical SAM superfamily enzyme YgiQ (UPF0313 family)
MKVILVKPFNKESYSFVPPIGLGYLASTLREYSSHSVDIFEAVRDKISKIKPLKDFIEVEKPDIIGIQVYSVDLLIVRDYLKLIKTHFPHIYTVLGGPHSSADPKGTMEFFGSDLLDFTLSGEAEFSFLDLVNCLSGKQGISFDQIPGLTRRDEKNNIVTNGTIVIGNSASVVDNIDNIPWPAWDLLQPEKYPDAPIGGIAKNFPIGPIMVTRGCPLHCTFCAAKTVYGDGFRSRSIEDVYKEIQFLKEKHNVKEIMIQDDNIIFKKKLVLEFCDAIKKTGLPWNCSNGIRADMINEEVAQAMKNSGCYLVGVGIESGSQKIIEDMRKKIKLPAIEKKIKILNDAGLYVVGFFIIGYPTETKEDIYKTIEFAKKIPIVSASFTNFLPLPGSQIYNELIKGDNFTAAELGGMSYYKPTRSFTPHIELDELQKLIKKAVREFHLRPQIIYKTLRRSGSISNIANLLKRFVKNYL